ncbi:MAG: type IV secretory system conjugative DNA transfer family protein [Clostridia bacterium]
MYLMDYCNAPEQTRQSIKKVLATKIDILTMNEQIMRMTSYSDFDMKALGQKKMVIYLIVHDEKKTYYPLVTIFLKQLYEVIINEARGIKEDSPSL